jgi:hypothetical protein
MTLSGGVVASVWPIQREKPVDDFGGCDRFPRKRLLRLTERASDAASAPQVLLVRSGCLVNVGT